MNATSHPAAEPTPWMSDIRPELLEAFVAVARELNFTRAAGTLFMSQSGLSRRIASLETATGSLLFQRTSRRVHLTEHGARLLPYALAALEEFTHDPCEEPSLRRFPQNLMPGPSLGCRGPTKA